MVEHAEPVVTPEVTTILNDLISKTQDILDEGNKAKSISRLEDFINKSDLTDDKVEGLTDVEEAINEYRDVEKSGMTPEEYQEEKASMFEAIQDAVNALEVIAEEEVEPRLESVVDYDRRYTLEELREMARREGLSPSGSKKGIAARLIARGVK